MGAIKPLASTSPTVQGQQYLQSPEVPGTNGATPTNTTPTPTNPVNNGTSTFTPSQQQQQPGLTITATDSKTGLPKSGTVRPDANGNVDLPGVGTVNLSGKDSLTVQIPGSKNKYKLKRNA